jgi:hypothetical protein
MTTRIGQRTNLFNDFTFDNKKDYEYEADEMSTTSETDSEPENEIPDQNIPSKVQSVELRTSRLYCDEIMEESSSSDSELENQNRPAFECKHVSPKKAPFKLQSLNGDNTDLQRLARMKAWTKNAPGRYEGLAQRDIGLFSETGDPAMAMEYFQRSVEYRLQMEDAHKLSKQVQRRLNKFQEIIPAPQRPNSLIVEKNQNQIQD